jgi:hypothetical protein
MRPRMGHFWTGGKSTALRKQPQCAWCRGEQPRILRRSAPQDDSVGNCLFLSTLLGIVSIPGIVGILTINNLRGVNGRFCRALIQAVEDQPKSCPDTRGARIPLKPKEGLNGAPSGTTAVVVV